MSPDTSDSSTTPGSQTARDDHVEMLLDLALEATFPASDALTLPLGAGGARTRPVGSCSRLTPNYHNNDSANHPSPRKHPSRRPSAGTIAGPASNGSSICAGPGQPPPLVFFPAPPVPKRSSSARTGFLSARTD